MKAKRFYAAVLSGALVLALSAGGALAAERTVKLKVWGMHCAKDELVVGGMLEAIDGVESYEIDAVEETAVVTFDDERTSLEAIRGIIDDSVYAVEDAVYLSEGQ